MESEVIKKALTRADKKNLSGEEFRLFVKICLMANEMHYTTAPNEVFINHLNVCERSISKWLSQLAEKDLVNVIQNRHKHERRIYVKGVVSKDKEPTFEAMSEAQRKFKEAFPDRRVDCEVPEGVDIDKLISKIQNNAFLRQCRNMSLKSCCIKLYNLIMSGHYDRIKVSTFSTSRSYTREEANSLFQTVEEIEI